ncbi:MAG TPA: hypothetical protein VF297_18580 [Pyrinomonadaceae bacterium]
MQQRPENFETAKDPEATLVSPRFDANDARRAHPVVPLAEAPEPTHYAPRARRAQGPRRAWTPALLAVALLAVAAVGGAVATKVMQGPRAHQTQEQAQPATVQAAEAPPQPSTPTGAEAPREEAPVAAKPAPRTRRTRVAPAPASVVTEIDEVDDDEDSGRRGKSAEKRREREDDVEKEMRKAMKRGKGKGARLVDVLTKP